jgi:hypothetical protein
MATVTRKMKVKALDGSEHEAIYVWCPGCNTIHAFDLGRWNFDGDMEKPTFSPSMLVNAEDPGSRCHSFVRKGQFQFLGDCHHGLKGQTVDLPPLPDWLMDDGD